MENNYFIIHGSYGNPYKNWIHWLKTQLSKRKFKCQTVNDSKVTKKLYLS